MKHLAVFTLVRESMTDEKKMKRKTFDKYVKLTVEKYIEYI
jgi:hypothetical protein